MPALIRVRKTSVFSLMLGIVIGFSLLFIFNSLQYSVDTWKRTKRITTKIAEQREKKPFGTTQNHLKCEDRPPRPVFKQRGDFWVLYNYVQADGQFKCAETITYATHGDYTFLDNVPVLVERWQGPISVALYAPGYDFDAALDSIAYLRNCEIDILRKYVSFHLFFGYKEVPEEDVRLLNRYNDTYDCNGIPPYLNLSKSTYKETNKLLYPINVARNIARETTQTHFVFSSDIELYPTRDLIPKFLEMVAHNTNFTKNSVFVLPIFEIKADQNVPETKTELQNMIRNNTAFVFHKKLCLVCHKVPDGDKWLAQEETEGLHIFTSAKRTGFYKYWEPFYIGTSDDPLFDERLTWEGQSNKMTQGYIMCLLNYTYLVLDNAFLIHKPGIKKEKVQLRKHTNIIRNVNKMLQTVIKDELDTIYGTNDNCYIK